MVDVTETNRQPDIDAEVISAASVSADSGTVDTLKANTLLGADVANATENQILVTQGDGTLATETQAEGPNPYDQAQTFTESGLSITHNQTQVNNGSIELASDSDTITRSQDDGSTSQTSGAGIVINPNVGLSAVEVELSANQGQVQDVFVADSSETILAEKTAGYSAGDVVKLNVSLTSGSDYYVGVYDDGVQYTNGRYNSPSFPYTSSKFDIPSTVIDCHPNDGESALTFTSQIRSFNNISGFAGGFSSGDATIEWDRSIPTDIFEWDVATFTQTLDSETVDVFVAYSSDGGSTWTRTNSGNPITRNYSLNQDANITASEDVRIEAELSRANTANNPTLDSAYRSWLV